MLHCYLLDGGDKMEQKEQIENELVNNQKEQIENELINNLRVFDKDPRKNDYPNYWLRDLKLAEKHILRRYGLNFSRFIQMFKGFFIGYTPNSKHYIKTNYEMRKEKFEKIERIEKGTKCSVCEKPDIRTILCVRNDSWVCPHCCAKCNQCCKSSAGWVCKNCSLKDGGSKCSLEKKIVVNYLGCEDFVSDKPYEVLE